MKAHSILAGAFLWLLAVPVQAQYWQQRVEYDMEIDFDHRRHRFEGVQKLRYENHSPDTLTEVYYHLYFNAFQPGSMMDVRSRNIDDPDSRVDDRIQKLGKKEIGYCRVKELKMNGTEQHFYTSETVLRVDLTHPIPPDSAVLIEMEFESQVPVQIRRSGRNNKEGVDYSMTQWYPKMAEYDREGWHTDPYVGREFYGVWADFDVHITIDRDYVIGATGYLQNACEIGEGYPCEGKKSEGSEGENGKKRTWHFHAPMVHDFAWAADPDFVHDTLRVDEELMLHFFYLEDNPKKDKWKEFEPKAAELFRLTNERFGRYPYRQYSIIQGGDGGMEYPMATLITGERGVGSLLGVTAHEALHSWYYGVLATNESKYPWMDEGFTTFAQNEILGEMRGKSPYEVGHKRSYDSYFKLREAGLQEPLSTHADHYSYNAAYGVASYSMGNIFLTQLRYIMGEEAFDRCMLRYYDEWKFKHPDDNDFIRVAEKESGLQLHWYLNYWIHQTKGIDYAVGEVKKRGRDKTHVILEKKGEMPMPLDIEVELKDGKILHYNIPLQMMMGHKEADDWSVENPWPWTHPEYEWNLEVPYKEIERIEIDPGKWTADEERENNVWKR